ncbi:mediator of RNA polymerase II transcription subunit 31 [Nematocida homosporus]|uniref:mediator of RNA polymerase II transcription subunit 31 n=1 Tax=Nematocida homosporus TaxID=1912981 RepID=UPI00221FB32C|nr:mediator of RNA polymerase II transcription subunit 31 [Nematocida homosporus]KAI5185349.1 mediator of RNA polymerase II transcription subunit 31 [Nematocida homosporus]
MSRFTEELEFIQCLCNPQYLQHLYQKGYFDNPNFIDFLKYLQYWKTPEYAKFLLFPQALNILDLLLNSKTFLESLKYNQVVEHLCAQQYLLWKLRR